MSKYDFYGHSYRSLQILLQKLTDARLQLAAICDLKDLKTFTEMAPAQSSIDDDSTISVMLEGKHFYPAIQIDPESLKVFSEIPLLIKDARSKGYSEWDILEWLATEQFEEVEPVSGRPVDYTTPEELLEKLRELSPQEVLPQRGHVPIDLLKGGDFELFGRLRDQWLVCNQ